MPTPSVRISADGTLTPKVRFSGRSGRNPNQASTSAKFTGVTGTGAIAYRGSAGGCTGTPVDFTATTNLPGALYVTPPTSGIFTFTVTSQMAGDIANPIAEAQSSDFVYTYNEYDIFRGPIAIGAATTWTTPPASVFNVSVTPTTGASVAIGGGRTYTETVTKNGSPDTTDLNSFTFKQLTTSPATSTPGEIAYVEYTVSGTTYCTPGYTTNAGVQCPAADTPEVNNTADVNGVTVTYHTYGAVPTPGDFTEVQVTGIGTFMPTITDNTSRGPSGDGTGPATAFGYVDLNTNQTFDSATEPSGTGGLTTFTTPVGASLTLVPTMSGNGTGPGAYAEDQFSNGQYYHPSETTTANVGEWGTSGDQANFGVIAEVLDQSGNQYGGNTQYAVTWTLHNTGLFATNVYLTAVAASDGGASQSHLLYCATTSDQGSPSGGQATNCTDTMGNNGTSLFKNPGNGGTSNATGPSTSSATALVIAGQSSLTFTSYTSNGGYVACGPFECGQTTSVGVNSSDTTNLSITTQLAADCACLVKGANIGSPAAATVGWAAQPAAGATASGTIVGFDPCEAAPATTACPRAAESEGTGTATKAGMDVAIVNTGGGLLEFVQFDLKSANSTSALENGAVCQSYSSGTPPTTRTEDVFEGFLANGKTFTMTNYEGTSTGGPPGACASNQTNNVT